MIPLHAIQLSEAAVAAGHEKAARVVDQVLSTIESPVGLLATGHLCFGAMDRARGDVARTLGRLDEAVERYERAINIEELVGARIYANRSRLGLAQTLAQRRRARRPGAGRRDQGGQALQPPPRDRQGQLQPRATHRQLRGRPRRGAAEQAVGGEGQVPEEGRRGDHHGPRRRVD